MREPEHYDGTIELAGNDGAAAHDSATLSGTMANAAGTVTYNVYSDNACTDKVADAGTVNVTNQASYFGDSNNNATTSICTDEQFVISQLIDLAVTKAGAPAEQELGAGNITWTMAVTNNGSDTATGVTSADPMPAGNTFVSASTTQGSCMGGAVLHCSLGTIPAGGSVTITLVTTPSAAVRRPGSSSSPRSPGSAATPSRWA